jgi:hypothetical protein
VQANVFITDDGSPCLADFGLTTVGELTRTVPHTRTGGDGRGVFGWLAPEFLENDDDDEDYDKGTLRKTSAGDVFAFGRLIYAVSDTTKAFDCIVALYLTRCIHRSARNRHLSRTCVNAELRVWSELTGILNGPALTTVMDMKCLRSSGS